MEFKLFGIIWNLRSVFYSSWGICGGALVLAPLVLVKHHSSLFLWVVYFAFVVVFLAGAEEVYDSLNKTQEDK